MTPTTPTRARPQMWPGPAPQEGTDTMTTDQDPGVLRAQARARAKAAEQIAMQLDVLRGNAAALADLHTRDAAGLVRLAAELRALATMATDTEYAAVALAKDYGATWQAIADRLGMPNRQNAAAKYGTRGAGR